MQQRRLRQRVPQIRILPYKMGSKGATLLAEGLRGAGKKCFKVFPDKAYVPRRLHTIINWGSSNAPNWDVGEARMLNHPYYVRGASNKLTAFEMMQEAGVSIPEFTTDYLDAASWRQGGYIVVERNKLTGHSGEGITLRHPYERDESGFTIDCPLYVKYIKKEHEYRVHVFNGNVIDIQQKRKKQEVANEDVDYQVRNHANGWVYCRNNLDYPASICSDAISAVAALGLDFGAVDIIYNRHQDTSYVLEINTAPGLSGHTLDVYVEAITGVM